MQIDLIWFVLISVVLASVSIGAVRLFLERQVLRKRYLPIVNLDEECDKRQRDLDRLESRLKSKKSEVGAEIDRIRSSYAEKKEIYDKLRSELAIIDDRLALSELGIYEPHFDFGDSESFKQAIRSVRDQQKALISAKAAVTCRIDWQVDGSRAKGRTMINRQIRLTLRAFNNECEAAIANTRWNNVNAMERRIDRAKTQIDKMNESNKVYIEQNFYELKRKELFLTHEYREKKKQERDEMAEANRLAREEKKLIQEAAKAAKEEERYQQLLSQAREEARTESGESSSELLERIELLEKQLAEAHEISERAKSLAEMTRSGYVYIISNIGSFGEDIVKIGLTRRLNPEDRVKELGDAGVPFTFDTHAIIYAENSPELENALHREFHDRRVNFSNMRKEFFRVSLDEVEEAVGRLAPNAEFFKDREAQEYHETLARRADETAKLQERNEFPATI